MQVPASKCGLGWTYEKAIQWEENIYNGLRGKNYEVKVNAFLNNCYTVMELENKEVASSIEQWKCFNRPFALLGKRLGYRHIRHHPVHMLLLPDCNVSEHS